MPQLGRKCFPTKLINGIRNSGYYPMANARDVWFVNIKPFKYAHFATFPTELIEKPIKAGCPEGGIVLDIFMGAGTTALTAQILGRNYIGIELNPKYIEIANKRLNKHQLRLSL